MLRKPEISLLKDNIASFILNYPGIREAFDVDDETEILYENIYPYLNVPQVQETVKALICFEVSCPSIRNNEYFKNNRLIFWVMSHREIMETKYGTRTDLLGDIIFDIFNWNHDLGLEVKLVSDIPGNATENFYYRKIEFEILSFNSLKNGIKDAIR